MAGVRGYDAGAIASALGWREAIEALRLGLLGGLDPETEPPRTRQRFGSGELLTMPSGTGGYAGVKLATVIPDSPTRNSPRINGIYVLFDATTLAPMATLDGGALTALRTATPHRADTTHNP